MQKATLCVFSLCEFFPPIIIFVATRFFSSSLLSYNSHVPTDNNFFVPRGHSIITFALRGEGGPSKCDHMRTSGGGRRWCHINANVCIYNFLIEHLVHKLFTIVTKFPVLLKEAVLKRTISRSCLRLQINYVCFEQSI